MAAADSNILKLAPDVATPASRTAPHNIEAEQSLLGAILVNNDAFYRVSDFLELGELMVRDALNRTESCGAHFREESQTADGEALRDDEHFAYVAAWEYAGQDAAPILNKEPLEFESIHLSQRNYK